MKKHAGGRPERFDEAASAELAILSCLGLKSITSLARENGCSRNTVLKYVNRFRARLGELGYAN
ncbi:MULTISPECIES: hypothetical protein [Vibrio]|uniref:hypothetical protein n=1 Tax=Vibrio TaxID=662 RepID=UPI000C854F10|nr:hypothetical protein [Vibrio breoganii]